MHRLSDRDMSLVTGLPGSWNQFKGNRTCNDDDGEAGADRPDINPPGSRPKSRPQDASLSPVESPTARLVEQGEQLLCEAGCLLSRNYCSLR